MNGLNEKMTKHIDGLLVPEALEDIFELVNRANKYVDETTPWILDKDETRREELKSVMYHLAEALRVSGVALLPFLPETAERILSDLSTEIPTEFGDSIRYGVLKEGTAVKKGDALYKRIDVEKECIEMEKLASVGKEEPKKEEKKEEKKEKAKKEEHKENNMKPEITIDDFDKVELKVGKILTAEKVEGSRKLLHFTVDTGDRVRSIASGVAKYFTPEEMVGKEVVVVTNLKPATLGGVLSEGMILFADSADGIVSVEPSKPVGGGATVC